MFDRLAGTWTYWGWRGRYFDGEADARAFFDELRFMLAAQICAPNSPQWFNTGLHWAYGIDGPAQGHWRTDPETGVTAPTHSAYEFPQPHACFIQSVADDLVNENGIMDLWVREARLFKYGSGTGSNFSTLRGENEALSGGGKSSGLMSFLKIGDRAAGAIKSGGTTRRAAKMVIVDIDHPDIEDFIDWKVKEEQKVAALVTGSKVNRKHLAAIMRACVNCEADGDACFDPKKNPALKREISAARKAHVGRISLSSTGFYATPDIAYDRATHRGRPFYYFAYGAAVSEVAIDTLTGEHKVLAVDILHDVGRSLNPVIDMGQIEGGFVQGQGWLTTEELVWDDKGRLLTHSPATYKIPTASDRAKHFTVTLWDGENVEPTINRSKAVGEPPFMLAISVFSALNRAIAATAPGKADLPQLDAPATPERILKAITGHRAP